MRFAEGAAAVDSQSVSFTRDGSAVLCSFNKTEIESKKYPLVFCGTLTGLGRHSQEEGT